MQLLGVTGPPRNFGVVRPDLLRDAVHHFEGLNVVVGRILDVVELRVIVRQLPNDVTDGLGRLEPEDILRVLRRHLVVSDVVEVIDVEPSVETKQVFDGIVNVIRHFADGEVARSNVEYSGDRRARLDCADVGAGGVLYRENGPPNGGIGHVDDSVRNRGA